MKNWKNVLKNSDKDEILRSAQDDRRRGHVWDVAVVGAGAAGLMAAIMARRKGAEVLLLDGREKIGAKILMSGGTRCNVTNQKVTEKDFESEEKNILKSVLAAFKPEQALRFFESLGVSFVLEPGGKYFPSTHSGRTILEAFLKEVEKQAICLETGQKIKKIFPQKDIFILECSNGNLYHAKTVILTTGGLSFPATGSDGSGYEIAKFFGHSMIPTIPALTPLKSEDGDWRSLSGVALPVCLRVRSENREFCSFEGDFLFTHFGFSGPVVLNASRYWIRAGESARVLASFLPAWNEDRFREHLKKETESRPSLFLKNWLADLLPKRFVEIFLKKCSAPADIILNQISRELREKIITNIFRAVLPVNGSLGYAKAEVTAGGIGLSEVDRRTLESKKQKGLFFAGEILDVDGRIGGFNFQWAWASGVVAGQAAAGRSGEK